MRAVLDAGPIIHLSWIDYLALLGDLFDEAVVPPAVRDEVLAPPEGTLGLEQIQAAFDSGALTVRAPSPPTTMRAGSPASLGAGERAAIALAEELGAELLVTDDAGARREAMRRGLRVTGTLGVLREAREGGRIPAVLPLHLELHRFGFWISPALIARIEQDEDPAGEPRT